MKSVLHLKMLSGVFAVFLILDEFLSFFNCCIILEILAVADTGYFIRQFIHLTKNKTQTTLFNNKHFSSLIGLPLIAHSFPTSIRERSDDSRFADQDHCSKHQVNWSFIFRQFEKLHAFFRRFDDYRPLDLGND